MDAVSHEYKKQYPIIRPSVVTEIGHGMTVSNLAYRVGRELGLPDDECHDLAVAGFVHDIGKLELAKYVQGHEDETLIIEEMRYVRRHSLLGALILQEKGYSQKIVDIVKFHHENCDGTGYPMNLTREDIPFGSRILRVCDVFAALTMDRPYRKAFDVGTAMEMMIQESKNFDIQVFLAFMNVVNSDGIAELLQNGGLEQVI